MDETKDQRDGLEGGNPFKLFTALTPKELEKILPQYEILELIGQGGMGAVYKARQPKLDRFVAIKLLPPLTGEEEQNFRERFEREARAMAQLNHPHIVTVHDFGESSEGHLFIVMEYVDGTDLHRAILSGTLTVSHSLAWVQQICSALQYAHDHDVVHRDIKPANILISNEGQAKIGDFGLAKLVGNKVDVALTQTQVALGTPDYAAPETMELGVEVDHRADIYSLGVLFYQLLTQKVPRGAWKPPSAYVPEMDPRLDGVVVKAMQPDPSLRYQTVGQLSQALTKVDEPGKSLVTRTSSSSAKVMEVPAAPKDIKPAASPKTESAAGLVWASIGAILLVAV
ncbi:MAG: serine/threonine-protein kinase, partial [Verrucomicrobiota bacterium]